MGAIAGGFISGIGGLMAGQTAGFNADSQAADARFNAEVARQEAKSTMEGAAADAVDFRRQQMARVSASKAIAGGSGFLMEGSPLMVTNAAVTQIEFGTDRIIGTGLTRSARLRTQGKLLDHEAAIDKINAKNARISGWINLASGVVGGVNDYSQSLLASGGSAWGM